MAQIPPITDSYIDEIIKSQGAYIEGVNKTQGIKLRELIKRLNNYFEQEIPKNTSQLINDSNYVTNPLISGLPEENGSKRPFIIRPLANYNPDEVFGTGTQPLHVMLVATELIAGKETVTQLKISDGVTAFKNLKNLVADEEDIRSITYAELIGLINSNSLVAGKLYLLSDFQTVHNIPNTSTVTINTGQIEPIIVKAISINQLSPDASSTIYPDDILTYTTDNSILSGATKGVITYRLDTKLNISTPYDWRAFKYRRYKLKPNDYVSQGYTLSSVVQTNNKIYVCIKAHSTAQAVTNKKYWVEVVANNTRYLAWQNVNISLTTPGSITQMPSISIPVDTSDYIDVVTFPNLISNGKNIANVHLLKDSTIKLYNIVFYQDGQDYAFYGITIGNNSGNVTFESNGTLQSVWNNFTTITNSLISGTNNGSASSSFAISYSNYEYVSRVIFNVTFAYYNYLNRLENTIFGTRASYNNGGSIAQCILPYNFSNNQFVELDNLLVDNDLNVTGNNFSATTNRRVQPAGINVESDIWTVTKQLNNKTFIGSFSDIKTPNALTQIDTQEIIYAEQSTVDISGKEDKSNKVTTLTSPNDTTYPTTLAVSSALNVKANSNNPTFWGNAVFSGSGNITVQGAGQNQFIRVSNTESGGQYITLTMGNSGAGNQDKAFIRGSSGVNSFVFDKDIYVNSTKVALLSDIPSPVDITGKEDKSNKLTSLDNPNDITYPTTQAVSSALVAKANDADVLHKTGDLNESITGKKTFQQAPALDSLTGNRMLSLSATKEIESFYEITPPVISNATIITQLTTAANWNTSDVYTGTAITGAYQMQFYADANYWYYFYNDTTPIRIPRRAAQLGANDTEAQAGTVTNKYLTPANWGYLKGIVNNITALWQFTVGIGIGIAGVTSSFLKLAANTTAKSQVNLTPSTTDVTSPVNGDVWNNAGELKLMENSIVNRMVKLYNNELLKSDGNYILMSNQYGDLSNSVKIAERWVYDSDVIVAITGASWSSDRTHITPSNSKVMYKGQRYDDGTYTYEATEDNYLRRW